MAIIGVSAIAAPALTLTRRAPRAVSGRCLGGPQLWLCVVTGLIYLNQVLFTVYVLRVRHGDASFIARYLPSGWFAIARGHALEVLARNVPAPGLLAPSVLRVQAFLELPFVVFAYLTVCRWFGGSVYERARGLVWPASLAWTATFCLIEWDLHNPYTTTDLIMRGAAAAVVPVMVRRLSPGAAPGHAPPGHAPGLLLFAVSTVAFGWLVLVVYDTALLYNLAHVPPRLPGALIASTVLALARLAARRLPVARTSAARPREEPGRGIDSITRTFGWFLVLFFVPAIPVRYGFGAFGTAWVAAAAALALIAAAMIQGVRDTFACSPGDPGPWILQMTIATVAGLGAAAATLLLRAGYQETRLLWAAGAFFIVTVCLCRLTDRLAERLTDRLAERRTDRLAERGTEHLTEHVAE